MSAAVVGAIDDRRPIGVAGRDRASYLQGLLTNDIEALKAGTGCYAAWLTPQGRMITDVHVLESGDMMLLDVPAPLQPAILARLDQFLFSEDVQLADLGESLRAIWVHGAAAPSVVEKVTGTLFELASWAQYQNARAEIAGGSVVVSRIDQLGVPGFCIHADAAQADAVALALEAAGAMRASDAFIEAARIEAGYPVFGIDMTDDTIPLEAGIQLRAISTTKGCYVGQEIIIRVLHRGHGRVARRLVQLSLDEVAGRGARIFAAEKEVGRITSAVPSVDGGARALGYVHRDFAAAGSEVDVEVNALRRAARVTAVVGA